MLNKPGKNKTKFIPIKSRVHYGGAVIDKTEVKAVLTTIEANGGFNWTIGPKGNEFEKILSKYTGQKHVILTNSGSSSLLLSITALHLPNAWLLNKIPIHTLYLMQRHSVYA